MINTDEREKILTENFQEYIELGERALKEKKFNSAATLFFKAIAALTDLYLLKKEGIIPSSHTQRFRILEEKHPAIYKIVDADFPFYQQSYTAKMDEETVKLLKEDAERLKKIAGIRET
ncbi:MAG: hypothetical protein ACP5N3_05385 [Candidatus Nanoarchaeia archaeon]